MAGKTVLYGLMVWLIAVPAVAESEQASSILGRLKDSGLDQNLQVLDDYYETIKTKVKQVSSPQSPVKKAEVKPLPAMGDKILPSRENAPFSASFPLIPKIRGRDPFAITEEMVEGNASLQASLDFIPDEKPKFTVPEMHLRGLVRRKDGTYAAVLDIEGYGSKIVRKGDTIGLLGSGDDAAVRIKEIDRLQIVVEAGKVGKVIVVR